MNFIEFIRIIRKHTRYIIVALIFLFAIFYSQFIPEVPKIKKNKLVSYQSEWKKQKADISGKEKEKIYKEIFQSKNGDYYRLILKARTTKDEKINLEIRSILGEGKEIGSFDLREKDEWKGLELVFKTDGTYRDLVVSKDSEISQGGQFEGAKIFISSAEIHPLEIKNGNEIDNLRQTIFGGAKFRDKFLPGEVQIDNLPENFIAGKDFEAAGDYLAYAGVNLKSDGGAKGEYSMELYKFDSANGKLPEKPISSVSFFPEELVGWTKKDGACVFNLRTQLEKGKRYFLGIKKGLKEIGGENILKVKEIDSDEAEGDSVFLLSLADFSRAENGAVLLSNSFIEDTGNKLIYYYENSGEIYDLVDIFEYKGKIDFDESKKAVINKSKKGNFFTYKINTFFPFEKMRIEAEQLGNKEEQLKLEYSYDNIFWKEIPYMHKKDEPQVFDYAISDNSQKSPLLYLRVSYNGEKEKTTKPFGLENLKITALLNE